MKLNQKALADVEIGFPVIAAGVYHARLNKPDLKENKMKDGQNLVLNVTVLDNPLVLHKDGKEIENKGRLKMSRYVSLKPTNDYDPDERLKEIALAIKLPLEADLNLEDLEGKLVMVKVGVRGERPKDDRNPSGDKYPESNEIERITPMKDDDTFTPPPFG